jgi:hypothetical protein
MSLSCVSVAMVRITAYSLGRQCRRYSRYSFRSFRRSTFNGGGLGKLGFGTCNVSADPNMRSASASVGVLLPLITRQPGGAISREVFRFFADRGCPCDGRKLLMSLLYSTNRESPNRVQYLHTDLLFPFSYPIFHLKSHRYGGAGCTDFFFSGDAARRLS